VKDIFRANRFGANAGVGERNIFGNRWREMMTTISI
jgi:hypothetical protein